MERRRCQAGSAFRDPVSVIIVVSVYVVQDCLSLETVDRLSRKLERQSNKPTELPGVTTLRICSERGMNRNPTVTQTTKCCERGTGFNA